MRTFSALTPGGVDARGIYPPGQGRNKTNVCNGTVPGLGSGKGPLSSLLDSASSVFQHGDRRDDNDDVLILSTTTSECSIATEYREDHGGRDDFEVPSREEARQDMDLDEWCSVATEVDAREGVEEGRGGGIALRQERTPPSLGGVVKRVVEKMASAPKPKGTWTGHIVGLRLPSDVDPDFDVKNKPTDRRVDPSNFILSAQERLEKEARDDWDQWRQTEDTATIALDVHLSNTAAGDSKYSTKQTVKVHMTRDPSECIEKTLHRLQLTMQKKVGAKKKNAKKKGKKTEKNAKQGDGVVLWRKQSTVESEYVMVQPASHQNEFGDCTGIFGNLLDAMPIDACSIWNGGPECQPTAVVDGVLDAKHADECTMEGYERIEYTDSLTVDDVLTKAASITNLDGHILAVPITTSNETTSWIPLALDSCPPTIASVSTFGSFEDSHVFERTPLVVEVGLLHATEARIAWFADGEEVCADSMIYEPTRSDIGKTLSVVIVPMRHDHDGSGREEAYQFKRRVEVLPELPNVRPLRQEFMERPADNRCQSDGDSNPMSLRVLTYNILADQNASRDVGKDDDADRIYSHCKNEHIVKWRRHPLIVHEILAYRPDIIALQEVDTDVYDNYLRPLMRAKRYEGFYSQKGVGVSSSVREGCALFWALNVFESVRPVDMRTLTYREMIEQFSCQERMHRAQWKSLSDMTDLLDQHDHLRHVLFNKLGHVMQTVVLKQRKSQEQIVIGNTHLFYHPMASHIRCLKLLMACRQLEIEHKENQHCPIIFCGDFNSPPDSGAMKLILNRYLDSNCEKTWQHLCTYEWEEGAAGDLHQNIEAIDLELPPSFPSLMSAYPDPPEFTHFIEAFVSTLDYILVTNNFALEKVGKTPSREAMKKHVAMPNECMPSDHVSLVSDLTW